MTKHHKKLLALAAIASFGLSASTAFAQDVIVDGTGDIPYAIDGRNNVTRSGAGLCWRTGYWTAGAAETAPAGEFPVGCGCDEDIVPREKCEATPPPPVEPPVSPPVPGPDVETPKVQLNADLLFDFNEATLKPEGRAALDGVAAQAKELQLEVVIVTGHTDRIGGDAYNQRLSERRAASVKSYFVGQGIDASRIYTEGKGRTQPVTGTSCNNVTPRSALISCLQPDRRVDIEIIGTR
ncbi:MAG: OmpA family protein [Betaproteobacteria bacterium]|nr:OmpA family protein [Betaproteobacteria bacterium]MCL2162334.1 OmpA family protein [Betaproteobacteria bacterium]